MAIPGMFAPVVIDGRELADGGSVANLPIGVAQELGAKTDHRRRHHESAHGSGQKLKSFLDVYGQTNTMLTVQNRREDVNRLGDE